MMHMIYISIYQIIKILYLKIETCFAEFLFDFICFTMCKSYPRVQDAAPAHAYLQMLYVILSHHPVAICEAIKTNCRRVSCCTGTADFLCTRHLPSHPDQQSNRTVTSASKDFRPIV